MKNKYIIGGVLVLINLIILLILYNVYGFKSEEEKNKIDQVYNAKIETMKKEIEDLKDSENEIIIDNNVYKLTD